MAYDCKLSIVFVQELQLLSREVLQGACVQVPNHKLGESYRVVITR